MGMAANPMDDESSVREELPRGKRPEVKQAVGMVSENTKPELPSPKSKKLGSKKVPRGAIAVDAATASDMKIPLDEKARTQLAEARRAVDKKRQEKRRSVWDKLDAAKQVADEKQPRLARFEERRKDES